MEPLRWGIAGCGAICEKAVLPCMQKLETCVPVAGMRRNAEEMKAFAEQFDLAAWYADYGELVDNPDVEAVYIGTPPSSHLEQTEKAAAAGKHVLCEKPMAMNAEEGHKMVEVCRTAGVKLGVSYYRRYFPQIEAALEVVQNGEIGDVGLIRAYHCGMSRGPETGGWRYVPEIGGGGVMMDVGSHRIDLIVLFGGEIEAACGFAESRRRGWQVDDTATAVVTFESGAQGIVTVDWCSQLSADVFEIHGTQGRIMMPNLAGEIVEVHTPKGVRAITVEPLSGPDRDLLLLDQFSKWVRGEGDFRVPGEEGVKTTEVMEAVYANTVAQVS